ncbi:hypothetical protein GDO81_013066 [Engystomops pustulosus]|uniref:RNA helicase n=2 Tax=Engystomops pustulosus TaxID=76066 RepID=A0AAV7AWP8_ENGPU|nr:hypothetical protein GDO81_013066 [Engystomops pustulosus]
MELRSYQWEVIGPALEGKNIIIWLPTGTGKTRAALYVAMRHLEMKSNAKVAMIVNKVHLVHQHYSKEFQPHLKDRFKITPISGDSGSKGFFANFVKDSDIIICTAQILHNALMSDSQEKHVELTDFTLLIIDECHHTQKDAVYNKLMEIYLQKKFNGHRKLPQILGLTASPGTGGANTFEKAVEHILKICANHDTWRIMSPQTSIKDMEAKAKQPIKQYDLVPERVKDPFGDKLKELMTTIHQYLGDFEFITEFGTQMYEQKIVQMEKDGYRHNLLALSSDIKYENPKLKRLEEILKKHFHNSSNSHGIIFTRTRQSTNYLLQWINNTDFLRGLNIKAATLTGAGFSNQSQHMTQNEQKEVIQKFRKGFLNLLISTSVAEEGLDIPECNIVVRYGLMTNEISMVQARGRARAEDSCYSFLAKSGGKESRREMTNESLEDLMKRAIRYVQDMPETEYQEKVKDLQMESITERLVKQAKVESKKKFPASDVRLDCRNCHAAVAYGSDMRIVEGAHHVNINSDFKVYYEEHTGPIKLERKMEDWVPGGKIRCSSCKEHWGSVIIYRGMTSLPNISIKNFVLETPEGRRTYKQWKDVPFHVDEFNYSTYNNDHLSDTMAELSFETF